MTGETLTISGIKGFFLLSVPGTFNHQLTKLMMAESAVLKHIENTNVKINSGLLSIK